MVATVDVALSDGGGEMTTEYELKRIAEALQQARSSPRPGHQTAERTNVRPLEPVAVVGLAGYLPGCGSVREFWRALDEDRSLIQEIPCDRFDWRRFFDPSGRDPNKSRSKWGGFIPDAAGFDASFFNILPADAKCMDPRQRLLLMCVYQTL